MSCPAFCCKVSQSVVPAVIVVGRIVEVAVNGQPAVRECIDADISRFRYYRLLLTLYLERNVRDVDKASGAIVVVVVLERGCCGSVESLGCYFVVVGFVGEPNVMFIPGTS